MARKVFISFLGTNNYGKCTYVRDDFKSKEVRYTQVATLDLLTRKGEWSKADVAYILLTNAAESKNWVDNGHKNRDTNEVIVQTGLESQLKAMNLPMKIDTIAQLPDGNNEEEIWAIFESVFSKLEQDDELYFDLTHGYRYLPMLILVLSNYAKFLKNVIVKHISYGNYEGRNIETNEALLVDLLPFTSLQDWTFAAGQYLESGNVNKLVKLSKDKLQPLLRDALKRDASLFALNKFIANLDAVVEERHFCRGIGIIDSENFKKLKDSTDVLEQTIIPQLNPIIQKIEESFEGFVPDENVMNGFAVVKWCTQNNLYQQATTILQENIQSLVCESNGLNWRTERERDIVDVAVWVYYNRKEDNESEWNLKLPLNATNDEKKLRIECIRKVLGNEQFLKFALLYNELKDLRNDFNHSGMRNNPSSASSMRTKIERIIADVFKILNPSN